ncbi:hypothetical protein FQN49_000845 [Arthroderma sp. PD_2]|nr:hypothetical protein FQN49_000845 [Arthroderma sp. PD_2]
MPTYRIELASTGRAGCKNKECQQNKEKILKGELRLGSFVDTEQFQSWAWKHWGCVTPRQIASIQEIVGLNGDRDMTRLDGYDEISAESQKKVADAVEQGHVDDEDWKGDVEVNRPGKIGFRVRASKKKNQKDEPSEDDEEKKGDKTKKTPKRQRAKKKADEADEEADEPVAKKAKSAPKATNKKTKAAKAVSKDEEDEAEIEEEEDEPAEEEKEKSKKKEKKKPAAKASKRAADKETPARRTSGRVTRSRTAAS